MLEGTYPVYYEKRQVGTVQLIREGLYIRVSSRCEKPCNAVLRLALETKEEPYLLGVPIPQGDGLALDRRLPAKGLPDSAAERACLYSLWPLPKVEREAQKPNENEPEVEEKIYIPGEPIPDVEKWEDMRVKVREDGELVLIKKGSPSEDEDPASCQNPFDTM